MARGMVEGARAGLPLLTTAPPPGFWGISRLVAEVQAHHGEPKIEVIVPSAEIGALRMEIVTEGDALLLAGNECLAFTVVSPLVAAGLVRTGLCASLSLPKPLRLSR